MKPTVVILLSDKRSGSTIFQKVLCSHPQIRQADYSPHRYLETQHWLKAARLLDMPRQAYYGHEVYAAFKSKANARAFIIDCIQKNVPDFQIPNDDRTLVFEGWEALCHKFATPVFFEKSPQHLAQWASLSLMLEWIQQTEFNVKIVGLVRNPMSVMYSAYELFKTVPTIRQHGWADMYRNLLAFEKMLPENTFLLSRYEDIIADTPTMFARIFDFIGVDKIELEETSVHTSSRQKWLADEEFTLQLHDSVKQMGRHFGYSDEDMYNPPKPEPSLGKRVTKSISNSISGARHNLVERFIKPILLRIKQKPGKPDQD